MSWKQISSDYNFGNFLNNAVKDQFSYRINKTKANKNTFNEFLNETQLYELNFHSNNPNNIDVKYENINKFKSNAQSHCQSHSQSLKKTKDNKYNRNSSVL